MSRVDSCCVHTRHFHWCHWSVFQPALVHPTDSCHQGQPLAKSVLRSVSTSQRFTTIKLHQSSQLKNNSGLSSDLIPASIPFPFWYSSILGESFSVTAVFIRWLVDCTSVRGLAQTVAHAVHHQGSSSSPMFSSIFKFPVSYKFHYRVKWVSLLVHRIWSTQIRCVTVHKSSSMFCKFVNFVFQHSVNGQCGRSKIVCHLFLAASYIHAALRVETQDYYNKRLAHCDRSIVTWRHCITTS